MRKKIQAELDPLHIMEKLGLNKWARFREKRIRVVKNYINVVKKINTTRFYICQAIINHIISRIGYSLDRKKGARMR